MVCSKTPKKDCATVQILHLSIYLIGIDKETPRRAELKTQRGKKGERGRRETHVETISLYLLVLFDGVRYREGAASCGTHS